MQWDVLRGVISMRHAVWLCCKLDIMLRNWQIREAVAHTKIVCGFEDFKVDHNIMCTSDTGLRNDLITLIVSVLFRLFCNNVKTLHALNSWTSFASNLCTSNFVEHGGHSHVRILVMRSDFCISSTNDNSDFRTGEMVNNQVLASLSAINFLTWLHLIFYLIKSISIISNVYTGLNLNQLVWSRTYTLS